MKDRDIDPGRPTLEYLTFDRPRFQVDTGPDIDNEGWCIDGPGLYITCRICGIPVAVLAYGVNLHAAEPEKVWGLDDAPGNPPTFTAHIINTSLAGAVTGNWHDLEPSDNERVCKPAEYLDIGELQADR